MNVTLNILQSLSFNFFQLEIVVVFGGTVFFLLCIVCLQRATTNCIPFQYVCMVETFEKLGVWPSSHSF